MLSRKPSYEELEQRIRELEKKAPPRDTETALRESRELLENILLSQRDAIFILNSEIPPAIIDCNPSTEKIFGYSRQETLGKDTAILHISKEAAREFQRRLDTAVTKKAPIYVDDFVMKRKDGALFPAEHTVVPLSSERADHRGWVYMVQDLSREKQMEEEIRQSKERYHLLADNVSDVIFIRDMNFRFTYISPSVEKMTGYSVEEAMALTLEETYTPRSMNHAMEAFMEELSRENAGQSDPSRVRTLEMEGYRKDGSIMWTEAKMSFLRDSNGRPTGVLGVSRDITERKQAELTIRISEERYRSIVEDMPALMCRFLPEGTLTFANKTFCDYFGRKREDLIGRNVFQFIPEEERQEVKSRFSSLRKESAVITYEHQVIAPDGTRRWQQRTDRALFDEAGILKEYQCLGLDVSERKGTEETLLKSDIRFKKLSSHVPGMIYQFMKRSDGTYCVPFTTESIRDFFGCSPQDVREDFSSIAKAILTEDLGKVIDSIESSAERMTIWECEYRVRIPGRVVRWMFGRSTPEKLPDGSIIWHGFNTDITDRKQMEEALRKSEIHYRSLFDNSLDAFLFTAPDGSVLDANPAACKMFGTTMEDLRNLGRSGLVDTTDPRLQKALEERARAGKARAEITMIRADQTKFQADITSTVFSDQSGQERTAMIIRDVTERKRAEEAMREGEKRYKQLFNHAPAGIYELDFNKQRFITVNDVMCKYTGYSQEEFLKMSPYDILSEDGKSLYAQRCKKLLAGENVPEAVEYKITTKGGKEIWVALNVNPTYENGKLKGATAVVHDITERYTMEQKLKESEERLKLLSMELMKSQERERARISKELHDELGQSLAILKHRVRSIGKKLTACQPQLSHDNDATVEFVDEIIEKVRQISRDLNPSGLDDMGLCSALRSLADNFMREYEIPVSLDIQEVDGLFGKESERNLYRIFQEALTNIAKHADARHVNVQISKGAQYVRFLIEDDGKGFDAAEVRARDKRRRGLGLVVMEERADLIGGTLEITSREVSGGTRILLTVPIEKEGR